MARYDAKDQARMRRSEALCAAWQEAGGGVVGVAFVPIDVVEKLLAQGAEIGARRHRARLIAGGAWMARLNADGAS